VNLHKEIRSRLFWLTLFSVAFAFVESSVVVYLRAVYYPAGFDFPLKLVTIDHLAVELAREVSTIIILVAAGVLAGGTRWQKFGWFMVAFGVWDVFYYVWLKVVLGWPKTITDWDVLFLLPLPWIGPVIAPVLISLLMIGCGVVMVSRIQQGLYFKPTWLTWVLAGIGTLMALYSFMYDLGATLGSEMPMPYPYEFLAAALLLYSAAFLFACRPPSQSFLSI
jgi:hypothetical protein